MGLRWRAKDFRGSRAFFKYREDRGSRKELQTLQSRSKLDFMPLQA